MGAIAVGEEVLVRGRDRGRVTRIDVGSTGLWYEIDYWDLAHESIVAKAVA